MPRVISSLPVGSKVVDPQSTFYGKPILWVMIGKDHPGYPTSSVTLLSDRILSLRAFDAREPNNPEPSISTTGNNLYSESNLRHWLNGTNSSWYVEQNTYDEPPTSSYVENAQNSYGVQTGFLSGISAKMKAVLKDTSITTAKNVVSESGGSNVVTDKVFLLSKTEMGLAPENGISEGTPFDVFVSAAHRSARPSPESIINSEYYTETLSSLSPWMYWLRTPISDTSNLLYAEGMPGVGVPAFSSHVGVRPAINIDKSAYVADEPNENGEYVLMFTAETDLKLTVAGTFPQFTCTVKSVYTTLRFAVQLNGVVITDIANPKFPQVVDIRMDQLSEGRNIIEFKTTDDRLLHNKVKMYLHKDYKAFPETQFHHSLGKTITTDDVLFTLKRPDRTTAAALHRILGGIG